MSKFENWGNAVAQAQVERYLAQSQNIVELERRMKDIEGYKTRYVHYI
jgi:hypothetical protein